MQRLRDYKIILTLGFGLLAVGCSKSSGGSATPAPTAAPTTPGTTVATYKTNVAPATLSLELPESLTASSSKTSLHFNVDGGMPDMGSMPTPPPGDEIPEAPETPSSPSAPGGGAGSTPGGTASSSQGLSQLKQAAAGLQSHLAGAWAHVISCDAVSAKMLAKCENKYPCSAAAGDFKIDVTKEFVTSLYVAMGESYTGTATDDSSMEMAVMTDPSQIPGQMAKAKILGLKKKIGSSVPAPACTIDKRPSETLSEQMKIVADKNLTYTVNFNTDKTIVETTVDYSIGDDLFAAMIPEGAGVSMPDMPSFSDEGSAVIRFNSTTKALSSQVKGTSTFGSGSSAQVMKYSTGFVLTEDAKGTSTGKLTMETGDFGITSTFSAGDKGGFANTEYAMKELKVSAYTLTGGTPAAGTMYLVGNPGETTLDMMQSKGMIMGDGTATPSFMMYMGPETVPSAGFSLFTMGTDPMAGATKSDMKITSITAAWDVQKMFYSEEWDADGKSTYSCTKATENGSCTETSGTAGNDYADSYATDVAAFEQAQVQITATGMTAAQLEGSPVYIVESEVELSALNAEDPAAFSAAILGMGIFSGDFESPSSTDLSGYDFVWQDPSASPERKTLAAYKMTFDSSGAQVFTKLTSLAVTAK